MQLDLDAELAFAGDVDGRATLQVRLERGGIGPVEVPAVLQCDRGVGAGEHVAQVKVPSLSLWSRRKRVRLLAGLAERAAPSLRDRACRPCSTVPLMRASSPVAVRASCTLPPLMIRVCPLTRAPRACDVLIMEVLRDVQQHVVGAGANFHFAEVKRPLGRDFSREGFRGGAVGEYDVNLSGRTPSAFERQRSSHRGERRILRGIEFNGAARSISLYQPACFPPVAGISMT